MSNKCDKVLVPYPIAYLWIIIIIVIGLKLNNKINDI